MREPEARGPSPDPADCGAGVPNWDGLRSWVGVLLGVALALLTVEVGSRFYYRFPKAFDAQLGVVPKAGARVRWRTEGAGTSRWLAGGVRAPQHPPREGAPRVLVVGDSFTEAFQVDDGEVYTDALGRALEARGTPCDIINLGRSGLSVADYVALAPLHLERHRPHWTVVQVRDDDWTTDAWDASPARFDRDASGRLRVLEGPAPRDPREGSAATLWLWRFRSASAFIDFSAVRAQKLLEGFRADPPLFNASATAAPRPMPPTRQAFPLEEELALLKEAYGGRLTVFYVSAFSLDHPAEPSPTEAALLEAGREQGVRMVFLREAFPSFAAAGVSPFGFSNTLFGVGHLNPEGHAAAAALLAGDLAGVLSP